MSYFFSTTITFEAALRDLATGSPKARAFAAHALGDVTDPTERRRALEALLRALEDDRLEVRAEACRSLGDLREPSAVPLLVRRLDDGVAAVRQNAAIALGTIGHADAFAPLALALREGPGDLRFQAATSLAEIDMAAAFAPLVAALADADPQVVSAAALALGASEDPRAVAPLLPHLEHRTVETRFDVAYALAMLRDGHGRAVLTTALGDPERAWDAVTALGKLGTPADADAIARALTNKKTPPEATLLAAGTLLRLDPAGPHHQAARRVVLAGLTARKLHLRGLAIEQVAAAGTESWARVPLEALAHSTKGSELLEPLAQALRKIQERQV